MKFHPTNIGLVFGTILVLTSCQNQKLKLNIDSTDILTIELNDRFGNYVLDEHNDIKRKTYRLDPNEYSSFLDDIQNAEKVGVRKLLVCYSIIVKTKDKEEILLRGRGNLMTISPDDIYYQIDVDIIKKYWDIDQTEFCKPTTPDDR